VHAAMIKQLMAFANSYVRTEYLLERNLDAIERAEDMVDPGNYSGMNHLNAARHFYQAHAVELGLDKQKAKMEAEAESQPVDPGGPLSAAIENSNLSMEFVQKAMAVARDEQNARRFLELAEKALEDLEERGGSDRSLLDKLREEFDEGEESYGQNNFSLAARQYEDLLKKINHHLFVATGARADGADAAADTGGTEKAVPRRRTPVWARERGLEFQVRGGSSYLSSSDSELDQETRAILLQDTLGGRVRLFDRSGESPWTHSMGLQTRFKTPLPDGAGFMADNHAEYGTSGVSDLLMLKLARGGFSLTNINEVKYNSRFPLNSFYRSQLKARAKQPLSALPTVSWNGEVGGALTRYFDHGSADDPSNQSLKARAGLSRIFGWNNELGAGVSGEVKSYADESRSYYLLGLPLSLNASWTRQVHLMFNLSPLYRVYSDDAVSSRGSLLSYGILSFSPNQALTLSLISDSDYLLYEAREAEFRKDRLNQTTTLRLSYGTGSANLSLEYHLDVINNRNAQEDSLYLFNLNENQVKNRGGISGYYILHTSVRYSSKISVGLTPGYVRQTYAEDAFYRNMVLGQTYVTWNQTLFDTGFDLSLTYDGGWDGDTFDPARGKWDRVRDNLFLGVNFYVNL
jgi:hypothetical protein